MNQYRTFVFKSWNFDQTQKKLFLRYSYDDVLDFEETYTFDFDFAEYSSEVLHRAIDSLFFMAGISYYKAFLVPAIEIRQGFIDESHAVFFAKTYQKGLGEFFYVNGLDPEHSITFPTNSPKLSPLAATGSGKLVGLGGGKDSLVSVELLKTQPNISTWTVGHRAQLEPLTKATGLPHLWIERTWDPKLTELNSHGAHNGHVPLSAILACTGTVVAILSGKQDIVVSNERSANEPTLRYKNIDINHQYSKSSEFEKDYQFMLAADFGTSVRYYSLLRPLSELRIAEMFAISGFNKYKEVFSSCNRAFIKESSQLFWCGQCPKCAFVFLVLSPFVEQAWLEKLFGKNLLLDPVLEQTYRQLLGVEGDKPLECVGEVQESRAAMQKTQELYPELDSYNFDLSKGYDYTALGPHRIPDDVDINF